MRGLIVATALALGLLPVTARAEDVPGPPAAGGGVGQDNFFVGIIAPEQAGSSGFVSADDPNGPRPYTYTWVPFGAGAFGPTEPQCGGFGAVGTPYTLIVRDLSGAIVNLEAHCVPEGEPVPTIPPVPTIGEIWRAALRDIPGPRAGINPRPTGLTGLETWLWYEGPQELAVSASIGPWTVTGTAHITEVTFDMGDGEPVTATTPGSEAEPAARFVYEIKGTYDIEVTARWTAELVLTGPGLAGRPTPIGSAVLRSSERYPVQEVRGLLID
jgi:hypothetical protein